MYVTFVTTQTEVERDTVELGHIIKWYLLPCYVQEFLGDLLLLDELEVSAILSPYLGSGDDTLTLAWMLHSSVKSL